MSRQCPPGAFAYIVKPGDTFYRLAGEFNTTVETIVQANPGINWNSLQIGQRICIPGRNLSVCPSGSNTYTIRPGDTLFVLARRLNVSLDALIRANPGITPNNLQTGEQICIPLAPGVCPSGSETYTIQPGDTFFLLAERFNTTGQILRELNPGVDPNNLRVGQQICIPRSRLIYANRTYQVTFLYPANWRKVNDERYEGVDGFFQVDAIGGAGTIDEVCRNEANHVLQPYGANPAIQRLTVQNQEACLILPSVDQSPEMRGQAALIVRYPKSVTINGQVYNYFVLYADRGHIREFAGTLEFFPM